ncbi:hypothetical protein BD809_109114 [Aquimarina intermedia]|uniref:Uncharacterized protein n=2 Tax=Aquimarina intermedia TaxID=350814 RepID=A0A5S5BZ98_9FLAO|nr:hypothetical protein BD809_109114 [Aquimarina intermedia]
MILHGSDNQKNSQIKSIIASIVVVFSALVIFIDKITDFGITNSYGYRNVGTFIWMVGQSLSPILLCLGFLLKPYRFSYAFPIYVFFIQLYWVFDHTMKADDPLLHFYAVGFTISIFLIAAIILFTIQSIRTENEILLKNIRKATRFIVVEVRKKWVPTEKNKEYTEDLVRFNESLETLD